MDEICAKAAVYSCAFHFINAPWLFENHAQEFFSPICDYAPAQGSWIVCVNDNFHDFGRVSSLDKFTRSALKFVNHICARSFNQQLSPSDYQRVGNNATAFMSDSIGYRRPVFANLTSPYRLDASQRLANYTSIQKYFKNLATSNFAVIYLFVYLGLTILVGLLCGFLPLKKRLAQSNFISRLRGRFTLPAVSEKHAQPSKVLKGLFPTRLEVVIIIGYLAVHLGAIMVQYEVDENSTTESPRSQVLRSISDRLGILCFAQLPLIILFSGRNSFLEELSGLRYTTSIVLHKWISRVMMADAIGHAYIYVQRSKINGTLEIMHREEFWRAGIFAIWCGVLFMVSSLGYIRRKYYETFLLMHIVLGILFFRFLWVHVERFGWTHWIWLSVGLWILEKIVRAFRIRRFGGVITAKAEVIDSDIVRLLIPKKKKAIRWAPGQYIFLYIMLPQVFWQSHPFSVIDLGEELLAVIKAKDGATRRLLKHLRAGCTNEIKVMVEGPYGESCILPHYDSHLLLCGGSGIPGPLSYALQYCLPRTLLVIVCRDHSLLKAFQAQIETAMKQNSVQIYVTREDLNYGSVDSRSAFEVLKRKPDLDNLIENSSLVEGSLVVISCGPPVFVDKVRKLVAARLRLHPDKPIEYVEEYQTW